MQLLCQVDDVVEDRHGLFVGAEAREEFHVDLQHVKLVILQHVQRGIPRAEIVEPDAVAHFAEPADRAGQKALFVREGTFRDLDIEIILRHLVFSGRLGQVPDDIAELEIEPREIERDRREGQPLLGGLAVIAADLLDDAAVELVDLAVLLENADERAGRQQTVLRVLPARERLEPADLARFGRDHRLIVDLDIAVLDRRINVVDDILLERELILHRLVVEAEIAAEMLLDAVAGEARAVAGEARVVLVRAGLIGAAFERELHLALILLDLLRDRRDDLLAAVALRQHDEVVVGKA